MTTMTSRPRATLWPEQDAPLRPPDGAAVGKLITSLMWPHPAPDLHLQTVRKQRGRPTAQAALSRPAPRPRILAQLVETPGVHLRALQRSLDIELSTLEHHLGVLRRDGQAASRSFGHYKAYFPIAGVDRRDWDILFFLHQEKAGRILVLLAGDQTADHAHVAAALEVSPGTCSFHLKKLHQAGLLERERCGAHSLWSLREPRHVIDLIWRHMAHDLPHATGATRAPEQDRDVLDLSPLTPV